MLAPGRGNPYCYCSGGAAGMPSRASDLRAGGSNPGREGMET